MKKLTPYAKSIAATVAPIIVGLAAKYGFNVDIEFVNIIIVAVLTGGGVFVIPNKPAA